MGPKREGERESFLCIGTHFIEQSLHYTFVLVFSTPISPIKFLLNHKIVGLVGIALDSIQENKKRLRLLQSSKFNVQYKSEYTQS